jgi:hypothetical protein
MRPWNEMVKNALGIDNMEIFKLKTDYDRKKEENR